ncbi:hypothetical protein SanaruYs_14710 [Chryseotalea sanaruensis]|uniref:Uncharacterized protein n=1 Tax=Chryseotalea sanaruensis TaxID=2482724 RepID=A0A401U8N6_9BACT|nr:hypothetical protein [Chryseotalea sanaruensis]GCC51250.1 hypothetical protein SanaruYs_14710 [Chryseotalea sanaruensis]
MKILLLIALTALTTDLFGQIGYVKLDNDSTITGYLRYYVSNKDGHQGIELWRTKKDKDPLKIPKRIINEYAIKKDTFKVLHQFKPFHDSETYFEMVDAKLKSSGKVNLYFIKNNQNAMMVGMYTGGGLVPALITVSLGGYDYMYILEHNETGFLKALPSKKERLSEALMDFFPERYILKYQEVKGEIKYNTIYDLVKLYNSK